MNNFAQLWVRHPSRLSIDDQNLFHIRMLQALEQDTFPDHAGCARYDCFNSHKSRMKQGAAGLRKTGLPARHGQLIDYTHSSTNFRLTAYAAKTGLGMIW